MHEIIINNNSQFNLQLLCVYKQKYGHNSESKF